MMRHHRHRPVAFALAIAMLTALGGCQGSSQPAAYYVLGPSENLKAGLPSLENLAIGVGPVKIPGHLDRPHLVTRPGPYRMAVNEFHRWGDSFKEQVTGTLVENLSALLETPHVSAYPWERPFRPGLQVYVDIRRLDGRKGDSVALEVVWWIVDTETEARLLTRRFSATSPIDGDAFEAYVAAQNTALGQLSLEIAEGLVNVAGSGP